MVNKKQHLLFGLLLLLMISIPVFAQENETPPLMDSLPEEVIPLKEIIDPVADNISSESAITSDEILFSEETSPLNEVTEEITASGNIVLPAIQYRQEPLKSAPVDPIPIPVPEKRDPRLDKMFEDLSVTPITDGIIKRNIQEKHEIWIEPSAPEEYCAESDGPLVLEDLLQRAYEENPSIKILYSQLNQARMDVIGAKSNYFPKISFDGSISLSSRPLIGAIDIMSGQFGSYPVPGASQVVGDGSLSIPFEDVRVFDGFPQTFYSFKFVLEQPLFTWGKIPMAVEAYKQGVHAAEIQLAKKKKEVRAEISIFYQSLYYLEGMQETIATQEKMMERLLFITNESYKTGFIIYNDYLDVQLKAQQLITANFKIQDQYRQILIRLAALTGLKEVSIDMLDFSEIDENWIPQLLTEEEYTDLALKNNLDLRLLEILKDINTLQEQIEKSKSYLKPDFGVQLSLGTMGPDFPFLQRGWYGHNSQSFVGSIGFKSTLLDGGAILAGAMKKTEELNKTLYQIQLGKAEVRSFVARQLSMLELNRRNLEYYDIKIETDERLVTLRKNQFEIGGSEIDFLRSQIDYNSNFIELFSERIALVQNYYILLVGTGLL